MGPQKFSLQGVVKLITVIGGMGVDLLRIDGLFRLLIF